MQSPIVIYWDARRIVYTFVHGVCKYKLLYYLRMGIARVVGVDPLWRFVLEVRNLL